MSGRAAIAQAIALIRSSPDKRVLCSDMLDKLVASGAPSKKWVKKHVLLPLKAQNKITTITDGPIAQGEKGVNPQFYWCMRKEKDALREQIKREAEGVKS